MIVYFSRRSVKSNYKGKEPRRVPRSLTRLFPVTRLYCAMMCLPFVKHSLGFVFLLSLLLFRIYIVPSSFFPISNILPCLFLFFFLFIFLHFLFFTIFFLDVLKLIFFSVIHFFKIKITCILAPFPVFINSYVQSSVTSAEERKSNGTRSKGHHQLIAAGSGTAADIAGTRSFGEFANNSIYKIGRKMKQLMRRLTYMTFILIHIL